ncbi:MULTISPECIES: TonB-dependent receptor [unclassified Parabacteroides]|uniref:TonB-dependent receptor n=1 Tax=unclassified Parabacteroides TaxID=2649774 RepID=UPI00247326C5|nr:MULTISPECIES: TonB-dependent receptor [unclassified Parabacteroides]
MKQQHIFFVSCLFLLPFALFAQQSVQNIRGTVHDAASGTPLAYATVALKNTALPTGAITDSLGHFIFKDIPVGRYDIEVSYMGYNPVIIPEILLTSAKEAVLDISLQENLTKLGEVVVRPTVNKSQPMNKMALSSARMLSVEEASRFAGGFDDPARLAATFAGVNTNLGDNGIVVRGNAPKFLQWRLEDVEIPNPNHFAEVAGFGGGGLTALSSQVLGNSDFFTGAFPAEYGNALSGVFDLKLRTGNNERMENTAQIGTIGIDLASEGPLKKGGQASYLFNYRYSDLGLVSDFGMKYQDLSFKLNFPTKRAGTFSVWGMGWLDHFKEDAEMNKEKWEYTDDRERFDTKIYSGAMGAAHRISLGNSAYWKTTLAATANRIDTHTEQMDDQLQLQPSHIIKKTNWNFVLSSYINKRFGAKHTNRTGINVTGLKYDMLLKNADPVSTPLQTISDEDGASALLSAYTNSSFNLSDKWTFNVGLHGQYFALNQHYSIEPRAGVRYNASSDQSVSLSYGLHSRMELLNYYFTRNETGELINKDLDFTRAHHLVLSYDWNIGNNYHLRVEPYVQFLYDVPVIPDSSFSFLNLKDKWFVREKLENTGKGFNYGIDLTFEKFMSQGYYYMLTGSLFNARYKGGDHIWRDTRYNRNFLVNFLIGKEWMVGRSKQNMFSANINVASQGGERYSPVDEQATQVRPDKEVQYDESKAFSKQLPVAFIAHFTISYKINRKRIAHEFAIKMLNATFYEEYMGHSYNFKTHKIDKVYEGINVPNISYKIGF